MTSKQKKRLEALTQILKNGEFYSLEQLAENCCVSLSTISRDIKFLEDHHQITRLKGGVIINKDSGSGTAPIAAPPQLRTLESFPISKSMNRSKEEKLLIAKKAASLIRDNSNVIIGGGSTTYYMIDYIKAKNVTVFTDGLPHLLQLFKKGIKTYVFDCNVNTFTGLFEFTDEAFQKLSELYFDVAFLGARGYDQQGFSTVSFYDSQLKKLELDISYKSYILCDSTKENKSNPIVFCSLDQATLITDQPSSLPLTNLIIAKE